MDNQDFSRLTTEPPSDHMDEPMPLKARRAMPWVWLTILAGALALFVAWAVMAAAPPIPRDQRLLAVPGSDAPAMTAHPGPSPAHALPSASEPPAGATRR